MSEYRCPQCQETAAAWHYYPGVTQADVDGHTRMVRAPELDQLTLDPCGHTLTGQACHQAKAVIQRSALKERELSRGFDLRAFLRMRLDEDELRLAAVRAEDETSDDRGCRPGPVQARRAIVDLHHPTGDPHHLVCHECGNFATRWPCTTIRWLAVMYDDHPAFRPEWRPEVPGFQEPAGRAQ